jgi:hypothetical protein
LAALRVAALWTVRYIPTQDGPDQLANAVRLRELWRPPDTAVDKMYHLNLRPNPNWGYYALVAAMSFVVQPFIAEKIFLSLYVCAFAAAAYQLARAAGAGDNAPVAASALLPFGFTPVFHMGFFNCAAGSALMLLAVAHFWKRRDALRGTDVLIVDLLLIAAYFFHLMPALFGAGIVYALNGLWALSAADRRAAFRRAGLVWAAVAPAWGFPIYYLAVNGSTPPHWIPFLQQLQALAGGDVLVSFGTAQAWLGYAAVGLTAGAAIWGAVGFFRGRRCAAGRGAAGILAALCVVLYFVLPDAAGSGSMITTRVRPWISIFAIVWAGAFLGRRSRLVALPIAALFALGALGADYAAYRAYDRELRAFNRGWCAIAPGATMVYMDYSPVVRRSVRVFCHAGGYYALARNLVDFSNYEVDSPEFPVNFAAAGFRPTAADCNYDTAYDVAYFQDVVDYILMWKAPKRYPDVARVRKVYDLVYDAEGLKIFRIKNIYRRPERPHHPLAVFYPMAPPAESSKSVQ